MINMIMIFKSLLFYKVFMIIFVPKLVFFTFSKDHDCCDVYIQ